MSKGREKAAEPYQQILNRLSNIQHKVDSIDETNAFALRAEAPAHQQTVNEIFGRGKRCAQVYLAADGSRSVEEIGSHLGMKAPNVSPELKYLKGQGLIELVDAPGHRDFWAKKAIDRTLRISEHLCTRYNLSENGLPARKKKKRR